MYAVDELDEVISLEELPQHAGGAPEPAILATNDDLWLAYETAPEGEEIAIIRFGLPRAHYFGPPNDETLNAHPLYARGLGFYGIYKINCSFWVRSLEVMNRVHPMHNPKLFDTLTHYAFTFHDSIFECVSDGLIVAAILPNNSETAGTFGALTKFVGQCVR